MTNKLIEACGRQRLREWKWQWLYTIKRSLTSWCTILLIKLVSCKLHIFKFSIHFYEEIFNLNFNRSNWIKTNPKRLNNYYFQRPTDQDAIKARGPRRDENVKHRPKRETLISNPIYLRRDHPPLLFWINFIWKQTAKNTLQLHRMEFIWKNKWHFKNPEMLKSNT